MTATKSTPGPKERLLATAQHLFYSRGAAVGSTLCSRRRTSPAGRSTSTSEARTVSLQRCCAEHPRRTWPGTSPHWPTTRSRGSACSACSTSWTSFLERGLPGCRYFATDLAFTEPDHPAHAETAAFRRRLHALLLRELEAMDHPDPKEAAEQLHLLIEGTLVWALARMASHPAWAARGLAAAILDEQQSRLIAANARG